MTKREKRERERERELELLKQMTGKTKIFLATYSRTYACKERMRDLLWESRKNIYLLFACLPAGMSETHHQRNIIIQDIYIYISRNTRTKQKQKQRKYTNTKLIKKTHKLIKFHKPHTHQAIDWLT